MRKSESQCICSVSARARDIWGHDPRPFRPHLNIHTFLQVLHDHVLPHLTRENAPTFKGKKRGAPDVSPRKSKRHKALAASASHSAETPESELERPDDLPEIIERAIQEWASTAKKDDESYPQVSSYDGSYYKSSGSIPVHTLTRELRFTVASADDEDEALLKQIAVSMSNVCPTREVIDATQITLERYGPSVVAMYRGKWLSLLPIQANQNPNSSSHNIYESQDSLSTILSLRNLHRIEVDARLKLVILPPTAYDAVSEELPFRFQLETVISLLLPDIFEPPMSHFEGDLRRRLLSILRPPTNLHLRTFSGTVDIPYFYSVLGAAPPLLTSIAESAMQPPNLLPTLLGFQRRSVAWMLSREGKTVTEDGQIVAANDQASKLPVTWQAITVGDETVYFDCLRSEFTQELPDVEQAYGGILAEEPGLGKTLETIALILLNPAPERNPSNLRWNPDAQLDVKEIKTTLIVTPPALASQWVDEMKLHAPSLKVLVYDGWAKVGVPITEEAANAERDKRLKQKLAHKDAEPKAKRPTAKTKSKKSKVADECDGEVLDWCQYANTFDVVVTTYPVLRSELYVARPAPVRPRREDVVYSNLTRARSPLIMCEWLRVVMDEVQMAGGEKTEDMVSLIPRLSSFAVSGTPARGQISDLFHVLKFLRVDSTIGSQKGWAMMLSPSYAREFAMFFQHFAVRTMKADVTHELTIPQQTRFLVGIDLGLVERHVYDHSLETALKDLGLDARGVAPSEGWQVDGALLRTTLRRLRGLCTHPQVGQLLGPVDSLGKPGGLKTMAEVLQLMRDQNWRALMDDCKAQVQSLVRHAQLLQKAENSPNRYQQALDLLKLAEPCAKKLVQDVKDTLAAHEITRPGGVVPEDTIEDDSQRKGKGKARNSESPERDDALDVDDRSWEYEKFNLKRRSLQHRLREVILTLHRVQFLQGDVYHNLGRSEEEDKAYHEAELLRDSILKAPQTEAQNAMALLTQDAHTKGITQDALTLDVPFVDGLAELKSIKSKRASERKKAGKKAPKGENHSLSLINEAENIIENILNMQSAFLWDWRSSIYDLLTKKLFSSDDSPDGQEYQRTLDQQGEAETFLQAYTALLADRREALVNERTLLAAHDAREKKLRHTKAAMKAAAAADADADADAELAQEVLDAMEVQPEHEVLHTELSAQRKALLKKLQGRALKSVIIDLTTFMANIKDDKDPEKVLLQKIIVQLRQLITDQGKLMEKLDNDLVSLRRVFNQRLLYFRQLQEIGDTVADPEFEPPLAYAIQECVTEENDLKERINTNRARHRYLDHLARNADDDAVDEDDKTCILCRCDFAHGFITPCAHVFCEGCIKSWVRRKEGKTCPVCRVPISPDELQRFIIQEETPLPSSAKTVVPASRRKIEYNRIDPDLLQKIRAMPSFGDFGSKIQTLVQHLLYLQVHDPGAKSICFSAWQDSLHILQAALNMNGISCLRIDQRRGRQNAAKIFRDDPDISVLLLHGERENAGLNVTCASRVFLLESVVHHGFEIQAIARIDRMGQKRSTEVYCYYAEDTVEKNILDLAARQGLSLYTKENSAGTLNLSSLAGDSQVKDNDVRQTKKAQQKGDFIFKMDDMLAILFPHMYEDIEYLISCEEDVAMDGSNASNDLEGYDEATATPPPSRRSTRQVNAIAGPSRLG